jgi:hypothetical protein
MDQVNQFISLVYPAGSSRVALCLIPPDRQHAEHRFLTLEQLPRLLAYARYRNAHGWNVYITPSLLKPASCDRCKQSFQRQQVAIYLDCDQPACLQRIKQHYPYPTLVIRTSKGRYQVYWRLDQPVDVADQERLMSAMAADVGADHAATDVSRVLRLPGFWNRKPGRANTVDIVFSRTHVTSYQSLWEPTQLTPSRPMPLNNFTSTGRSAPLVLVRPPADPTSNPRQSESERDWYEVHRRLAMGESASNVIDWLQAKRSDKPRPRYYALHTVRKALQARNTDQ